MLFALSFQNSASADMHYSRTGRELDRDEIRYFSLFPNVDAVDSALLPSDTASGQDDIQITLRRGRYRGDVTLDMPRETFRQLLYYIDNFERVYAGQTIVDWDLLREFVRAYSPLLQQQPIAVKTAANTTTMVLLLAVTDSALVCYTGTDWAQWQTYNEDNILVLPFYQLESVQQRFIGKNFHLFALAKPFLQEREVFLALPPELHTIYNKQAVGFQPPAEALQLPDAMLDALFPFRRFHFSASAGVYTFSIEPHLYSLISGSNPFEENVYAPGVDNHAAYPLLSFDAAFSVFQRWSFGFSFAPLPSLESRTTTFPEYDSLSGKAKGPVKRYQKKFEGNSFALYASYAFVKPNAYFDIPLEMNIAAGAIIMDVSVHSLSRNLSLPYNLVTSTNNQTLVLPYVACKIDYFLTRALSLHGKADVVASGVIEDSILAPNPEQPTQKRNASIPLTRTALSFGISLHL